MLSLPWAQARFPVRELRACKPHCAVKKKKKGKKEIPWEKNQQNLLLDSIEGGMRQTATKMPPSSAAWGNR